MVPLLAERSVTKSNVKLSGFRSQLQASYVSSHTEELWYNETVCRWVTIYIYIYIMFTYFYFKISFYLCPKSISRSKYNISIIFIIKDPLDRQIYCSCLIKVFKYLCGLGSYGNESLLHIPQISNFNEVSPSDCLVSYLRHSLGQNTPTSKMQSVYSEALAAWATYKIWIIIIDQWNDCYKKCWV